jgi:hypothetical protein
VRGGPEVLPAAHIALEALGRSSFEWRGAAKPFANCPIRRVPRGRAIPTPSRQAMRDCSHRLPAWPMPSTRRQAVFGVAHQSLPDAEPAGSSVEEALFAPPPTDPTPRVPVDAAVWVAVRRSNVFLRTVWYASTHAYSACGTISDARRQSAGEER